MYDNYNMYEIEYKDGKKELIDRTRVCQYRIESENIDINPGIHIYGTGAGVDYIVESLRRNKPIIIFRNIGITDHSDIERIINTHDIRAIIPKHKTR